MRDVRAVLFDLDGTLVDTVELILCCHEHTLRAHFGEEGVLPRREILRNLGRSLPETLLDYAVGRGVGDVASCAAAMLETYREFGRKHHERLIRPVEGMREVLEELRERGLLLGLVTSKARETARMALDQYDLGEYFPLAVYHDDTARHKPDPEPLLLALERGGLDAGSAVYVGDSVHDIIAGRAAGVRTVAALWGPFDRAELVAAGADALAGTPHDLLELLPAPAEIL